MTPGTAAVRIGLATQTAHVTFQDLKPIAAVLQTQMQQHVAPAWNVTATVEAWPNAAVIPNDMSPIFIVDATEHNHGGLHTITSNGRAWAKVLVTRDWHLGASHECIELLIDPTGERTMPGLALQIVDGTLQDGTDRVTYLVEACDPLEDPAHSYLIDGIVVSDFYTQAYFDDAHRPGIAYSHAGSLTAPRTILRNGYLSWKDAAGRFHQIRNFDGPQQIDITDAIAALALDTPLSAREMIDRVTITRRVDPTNHLPPLQPTAE